MVENFSKYIELVALPQNSLELIVMIYFDCVLACFGIHAEALIDQRRNFLRKFEAIYTKALIDYHTTIRNHPKINFLTERVV
uniref:Integrase catalytic domain-containing protein n=2 Tax=Physcomitrium patens TaxID=3218 RepID=A0A2K1J8X2_PHYPA|nr:hypothetical protein PHYPA_021089 [Physcomitrium patens]